MISKPRKPIDCWGANAISMIFYTGLHITIMTEPDPTPASKKEYVYNALREYYEFIYQSPLKPQTS